MFIFSWTVLLLQYFLLCRVYIYIYMRLLVQEVGGPWISLCFKRKRWPLELYQYYVEHCQSKHFMERSLWEANSFHPQNPVYIAVCMYHLHCQFDLPNDLIVHWPANIWCTHITSCIYPHFRWLVVIILTQFYCILFSHFSDKCTSLVFRRSRVQSELSPLMSW